MRADLNDAMEDARMCENVCAILNLERTRPDLCVIDHEHTRPDLCVIDHEHTRPDLCVIDHEHTRPDLCDIDHERTRPDLCDIDHEHTLPDLRVIVQSTKTCSIAEVSVPFDVFVNDCCQVKFNR